MISLLEFEFPDTGEGVTEGTFLEWLVEEGEEVDEDQAVAEVETDKAVVDVPAPVSGTVREFRAEPGDTVKVGEVIMVLDDGSGADEVEKEDNESSDETNNEEEDSGDTSGEEEASEEAETREKTGGEEEPDTDINTRSVLALPRVRRLAEDKGVSISKVEGSGREGRVTEEDVMEAAGEGSAKPVEEPKETGETQETEQQETGATSIPEDVKATPATRKLAREKEVDLAAVEGSGRGGKITRDDVLEAAEGRGGGEKVDAEKHSEQSSTEKTGDGEIERVEISASNKIVAEKMAESRFTAPHVTHVEKADVTELVELREQKKDEIDAHLTYLPFIMKAVLVGLKEYPDLNAELDGENDEIIRKKYYDFNIAVDTERGLRIPVIEGIDDRTIVELSREIEQKVEETREGKISREDMQGGTFSITNIGVIGGEEFTPIINPPQVAILGIGKIAETAEVVDGHVQPRWTVKLSLSYDHRVVDGATAARFMNNVKENLEDPGELLMEI